MPTPLGPFHRVISAHSSDGSPAVIDDHLDLPEPQGLWSGTQVFVQEEYRVSDPVKAISGADGPIVKGMSPDAGLVIRVIDLGPGGEGSVHFTDTIDHCVVTHGTIDVYHSDGSKSTLKQGDFITLLGSVHKWKNPTSEWARFLAFVLPCDGVRVNGLPLDEAPSVQATRH